MDITYIPFSFPNVANVHCLFQTRRGGHSKGAYGGGNIVYTDKDERTSVLENRKSLQQAAGHPFCELAQVHGDKVIFDPIPTPVEGFTEQGGLTEADGLATAQTGLALMVKSADCQPILLAHKSGKHIMGLHVGWRGNKINFIGTAVAEFCEKYKILAAELYAVRGPSLGPQCAEFVNFTSDFGQEFAPWYNIECKTMNLWELTRHQLQMAGLLPANIFGIDMCTYSMPDEFFSYRREEFSGRQASLIWINKASS